MCSNRRPWRLPGRLRRARPLAFGEAKEPPLLSSPMESLEGQLENEAARWRRVTRTDDAWNAMRAVLAKEKPSFQGADS